MKKQVAGIILIGLCFLLVGCGDSWKSKVELTDLKIDDNYVVGKIKNKTDNYYSVSIDYIVKSGDFTDSGHCSIKLKPNSVDDIDCVQMKYDNTYSVEVKNVELSELTIPKLDNSNLNADSLEYYYKDIFEEHTTNMVSLAYDVEDFKYPYIDKVSYYDSGEIGFRTSFNYNGNSVYVNDNYDTITNKAKSIFIMLSSNASQEDISKIIIRISSLYSVISDSTSYTLDMSQALKRTDYETGKCRLFGNWCVSTDYGDTLISFYLERR